LSRAHLGITSIYLQGIDTREIVDTVHHRRPPLDKQYPLTLSAEVTVSIE